MQTDWLFCPYCEGLLRTPVAGAVDVIVRRDSRRTRVGIVLLAVLGGLGLLWALLGTSTTFFFDKGDAAPFLAVLIISFLLFLVSVPITLWRSKRDNSARGVGRVFLTTFALAGGAIVIGALLTLATIVFLLAVCFAMRKGN
jgi:hypothetical protein